MESPETALISLISKIDDFAGMATREASGIPF